MQPQAPPDWQPVVHHLLIQGMQAPIASGDRPVGPDLFATPSQELVSPHQRLAALLAGLERPLHPRGHRCHRELTPDHTRPPPPPPGLGTAAGPLPLAPLPHVPP